MTPAERGIALALESVPGIAKIHALTRSESAGDEDRFTVLVELRPYRGGTLAEAHYAIVRVVGRAEAARVTYGDADVPSATLLRGATELRLTLDERELALREAETRVLPPDEAWSGGPTQPLSILIIDNDVQTHSSILQASKRGDVVVDVPFGLAARAYARDGTWRQFDVIFAGVSGVRGQKDLGPAAPLDGLRFFEDVVLENDSTVGRRIVFVMREDTPLAGETRRSARAVLLKPLVDYRVDDVLDAVRRELTPRSEQRVDSSPATSEKLETDAYRGDVAALREKGGAGRERLADLLEKALQDPEAYAAELRAKAEQEGPASARAIPKNAKEILELLHEAAKTILSM